MLNVGGLVVVLTDPGVKANKDKVYSTGTRLRLDRDALVPCCLLLWRPNRSPPSLPPLAIGYWPDAKCLRP
jgi:hypothetical protein